MPNEKSSTTPACEAPSYDNTEPDDGLAGLVSCYCSLTGEVHKVTSKTCCEVCEVFDGGPVSFEPSAIGLTSETVGERLKRIYPDHFVMIITEANRQSGSELTADILENKAKDYYCALATVFIWERSAEGQAYWSQLARRETEGE